MQAELSMPYYRLKIVHANDKPEKDSKGTKKENYRYTIQHLKAAQSSIVVKCVSFVTFFVKCYSS